jgi:nitrate/TMAO reductase-like tetraheme cytochrome c subunit
MPDDQTPDQQPSSEESVTSAPAESATSEAGGGKHPKHGRRQLFDVDIPRAWLYGLLTAIVVLLAGATLFFAALTDPRTCGLCHVIKAEVDSYKTSVHAQNGVVCQDCHTKPGVFNYFVHNLQSLTHVYEYVSGKYQKPLVTFVGTADCVRCHPKDEIEKDVIIGNIRVNHKGIRDSGMQCVTCHSDVVHGNAAPVGARPLESVMSICGQCHNGVKQSRKCSICHINGVPPGSVTVSMHVKINPAQCTECHNKTFCSKCHNNIQMPHQSGWRAAHGPIVVNRGSAVCAKCHQSKDPKFCTSCHGLQMPHPSTWPQAHPARAKADPALCVKCHGNNSCIRCHGLQMPHPADWLGQHPTTYKADPSLCSKCHSTSFCVNCHGVSLPHSSAFISDHFVAALADGGVCVKCHGNGGAGPAGCFGGSCHTKGGAPAVP